MKFGDNLKSEIWRWERRRHGLSASYMDIIRKILGGILYTKIFLKKIKKGIALYEKSLYNGTRKVNILFIYFILFEKAVWNNGKTD